MFGQACKEHGFSRAHEQAGAHWALFYREDQGYLDGVMAFLEPGLEAGQPVALAVPDDAAGILEGRLAELGVAWRRLDMVELWANPARIIPAVSELVDRHPGQTLNLVGELSWAGRSQAEVGELARHEALVNLAWTGPELRALCAYDERHADADQMAAAEATHSMIIRGGRPQPSRTYRAGSSELPAEEIGPPPEDAAQRTFGVEDLSALRRLVRERAGRRGLSDARVADLTLAVDELVTNTVRHAGGRGRLRIWDEGDGLACQVEDGGHITDPLAGRRPPEEAAEGGVGLWAVNQLCDLVQLRSRPEGTVVRVRMMVG